MNCSGVGEYYPQVVILEVMTLLVIVILRTIQDVEWLTCMASNPSYLLSLSFCVIWYISRLLFLLIDLLSSTLVGNITSHLIES